MTPNPNAAALATDQSADSQQAKSAPHGVGPTASLSGPSSEMDTAERERLLTLLHGQTEVLSLISTRATLKETLTRIASLAEQVIEQAICSVQVMDPESKQLVHAAAPNFPPGYLQAVDQAGTVEMSSPSNLSAATGKPIYLPEILASGHSSEAQSPNIALSYGLKSCWAHPILGRMGTPVGVLAVYFRAPRVPGLGDKRILASLADLARFAIEHDGWAEALRSADQRFASLAANIPGVVYQRMVTPAGQIRYTYISDGVMDMFGVAPQEILADPNALFDCHGAQYRETFRDRLLEATQAMKMWDVEATIVSRDGQRKFTHAIARPHKEPDGTVLWDGVILDATRIKEAELEAAATEARTREVILESISQGLVLYDKDDRLVVCNSHFRGLFPELKDLIQPGVSYETIARATVESCLGTDANGTDSDEELNRQIESHRARQHVAEWHLPNGRWVLTNENRTTNGGTAVVYTDITELKDRAAALERSNQELQDFASIASHDLQEPLRKIEAFGDRLERKCGDELGEEAALYLNRIQSSTRRMRDLINDLLSYSRVTSKAQPFESCALKQIAEEVVSDLQIQIEDSGAKIEIGDLPVIDADQTQMRQLLQNLISNALKFRKKEVQPILKIRSQILSGARRQSLATPFLGDVCQLNVSDNGIGFKMKHAEQIFSIFQRLHGRAEYEGTGIGLATCRKIVERHGGEIFAKSELGIGTTFTAVLPVKQTVKEAQT